MKMTFKELMNEEIDIKSVLIDIGKELGQTVELFKNQHGLFIVTAEDNRRYSAKITPSGKFKKNSVRLFTS